MLHEFVEIMEKYDTGMEKHIKNWVSAIKA